MNSSGLTTVIGIPLTLIMAIARAPGSVVLPKSVPQLPQDSVAKVSQIATLGTTCLGERAGRVPSRRLELVHAGLHLVLGR